jgi:hypothetical protein
MSKYSTLWFVLIFFCVLLQSITLSGCNSVNPSQTAGEISSHTLTQNNPNNTEKDQAIRLAKQLAVPEQIAIAGLGQNVTGLNKLQTDKANCEAWKDQFSGLLSTNKAQQNIVSNDKAKISLNAIQLIESGQFLMDIPDLVNGVTSHVASFPIDLYSDVKKLKARTKEDKPVISGLRKVLKQNINAAMNAPGTCRLSIIKHLKSKLGLIEKQCTPKISLPVLDKIRDLAVPKLAFNTSNDVVKNETAWTAVRIFALTHGWSLTDESRTALEKALAENPDLGPLVDNGVDVLLKKENIDTVTGFLSKIKDANKTCGPKEPIKLNDQTVATLP